MDAVTSPAARVATTLIESRATSIGRVKVIAVATLAYAGHDDRMIWPIAITIITQTTRPAITARMFFDTFVPLER